MPGKVLIIDDEPRRFALNEQAMPKPYHRGGVINYAEEALADRTADENFSALLEEHEIDLLWLDYHLDQATALNWEEIKVAAEERALPMVWSAAKASELPRDQEEWDYPAIALASATVRQDAARVSSLAQGFSEILRGLEEAESHSQNAFVELLAPPPDHIPPLKQIIRQNMPSILKKFEAREATPARRMATAFGYLLHRALQGFPQLIGPEAAVSAATSTDFRTVESKLRRKHIPRYTGPFDDIDPNHRNPVSLYWIPQRAGTDWGRKAQPAVCGQTNCDRIATKYCIHHDNAFCQSHWHPYSRPPIGVELAGESERWRTGAGVWTARRRNE